MRGRVLLASGSAIALVVVACNALTGAGDLSVCEGAECTDSIPLPEHDAAGGADGAADGGADDGALPATCSGDEKRCTGNVAAHCVGGAFQTTACAEACLDGECVAFPSCRTDAGVACAGGSSCCETIAVPGGAYNRGNDATKAATVSSFELDKYEVTVARFRAFVEAGEGTLAKPPAAGAGAHPKIANSGWNPDWNDPTKELLPPSTAALKSMLGGGTWTDAPGANDLRPITNVGWFVAFAFCAWDGGRLPTNAEWGYAASGGSEQRTYPWSGSTIDSTYAAYACAVSPPSYSCTSYTYCSTQPAMEPCDAVTCGALATPGTCVTGSRCSGCTVPNDIAPVGSYPKGAGRWGHLDLAGNAWEWVLDQAGNRDNIVLPTPCNDCASLVTGNPEGASKSSFDDMYIVRRGGGWNTTSSPQLRATDPGDTDNYSIRSSATGFRCARD